MTNRRAIRELRALSRDILSDEMIDWEETERLLAFIRPLSEKCGEDFRKYEQLLESCRADGQITPEESERLVLHLKLLCCRTTIVELRLWLIIAVATAVLLAIFAG